MGLVISLEVLHGLVIGKVVSVVELVVTSIPLVEVIKLVVVVGSVSSVGEQ